jgi:hypothetical protein
MKDYSSRIIIKDYKEELFPLNTYGMTALKDAFLDYHIRAIATEKGLNTLLNLLEK